VQRAWPSNIGREKERARLSFGSQVPLTEHKEGDMFERTATVGRVRTRQAAGEHGLMVQYARTDVRKYSFAVRTIEGWNNLPEELKQAKTSESFKSGI